jgi:hypothetical protein
MDDFEDFIDPMANSHPACPGGCGNLADECECQVVTKRWPNVVFVDYLELAFGPRNKEDLIPGDKWRK